ncbi:MAG: hypothetical protein DRJ10_16290, partial [Bacteroidetes bacterium]
MIIFETKNRYIHIWNKHTSGMFILLLPASVKRQQTMTFKYFDRPEILTGLFDNKTTCDTCKNEKFCFDAELYYGEEEI